MALGAIRAARKLGVDVPRDLSVVGFDDSPLMAFTDPALTTVRQNIKDMGHTAVRLLLDQIQGKEPPLTELLFRPTLVVRASTSVAPEQVTSVAVDTRAGHKR
jgi:DNA-binding LacI/PurR family transcriptional regulator